MKDAVPGKEKDIWIDWLPGAKELLMSKKFRAEKGNRIQMMLLCSEYDNPKVKINEILAGIIEPGGTQKFVCDNDYLRHSFLIEERGEYQFLHVKNRRKWCRYENSKI